MAESVESAGMDTLEQSIVTHPLGEQPLVEARSAIADTFAGRVHVEWDTTAPVTPFGQLLSEPWVLDMDSTVKTLYGHQEGAEVGYNPHKPGRPSHAYHTYMLSSLRLVLRVDVVPGDEYNVAHATDGLWTLLDRLGPARRPALLRGDKSWGIERVMARASRTIWPICSACA
jgi:hypothetical protein